MNPLVSIILPVRNEARHIRECLNSIFNQDFPAGRFEVLAVDGMSSDATRSILEELKKTHANLRVCDNPGKTVTAGLNIGIANAAGEFIVRCDAHAVYAEDYIAACMETAEKTGAANVGGHMRPLASRPDAVAHAIRMAHESGFGLGGGRFHDPACEGYVETVWLGCYRKEVFGKIGLYNEFLPRSEDIELNARLIKAGYRCYLSPKIRACYFCRPDLPGLFVQRWKDGIGVIRTIPVNPSAVRLRHIVPLLFIASLVVFSALSCFPLMRWLLAAELLAYAAGLFLFSGRSFAAEIARKDDGAVDDAIRAQKKPLAALLLPLVFAAMHVAYGLGSLFALATLPVFIRRYNKELKG